MSELIIQPAATAMTVTPPSPHAALLQLAIQQGADIEKLDKLMVMQERWEAKEAQKAYNLAFAAFKAEAVTIIKNRKVNAGPLSGKSYAELFAVVNAVTPALSRNNLSAAWRLTKDDRDWIEVTCTIKHSAGHVESVSMGGPPDVGGAKNAIQARASTVSYLERYTLKAILGLAEQDDDDNAEKSRPAPVAAAPEFDSLIESGQAEAFKGMKALTAWWGGLTNKERASLSKPFAEMRRCATQADREAPHG